MVAKPERFAVGDQIDKLGRKLNQLVDYVAAMNITGDHASVIVRRLSPTRWGVSAIRQGGGGAGGGAGGTTIYIARTTGRTAAKTYTVDIYTGYTQTGTLVVADRIATNQTMITPNLDDTESANQLASATNLAVVSRSFAAEEESDPDVVIYFPIEHVGLI